MPLGGVRWYAGRATNNKSHEFVSPMNALAHEALQRAKPDIVSPEAWIFPAPKDDTKPIGYSPLKTYMEKAEKLAKVPHLKGGLWHPFRRGWATARKGHPSQHVARVGGWRDTATLERCYVQTDPNTMLAAVNGE